MNRGSTYTRSFRRIHLSVLRLTRNQINLKWLYGPEKFPGLLRNGPLGRVFRKPDDVKPGLELNRFNNFTSKNVFHFLRFV